MSQPLIVNQSAPAYQAGIDLANVHLDHSPVAALDLLHLARLTADRYHHEEDTEAYLFTRGYLETIREFLEERSE